MLINAFGQTKSLNEWANDPRCTVAAQIIVRRINGGWDSEQAITAGLNAPRRYNTEEVLKIAQRKDPVDRCPECKRPKSMCVSPCVEAIKRELNDQYPTVDEHPITSLLAGRPLPVSYIHDR